MKKTLFLTALSLLAFAFLFSTCSSPKPEKTIENLKAAINGESTASAKYAAFAAKAREEGYDTIAKMFDATSKAENIHASNHMTVLVKLGVEYSPQIDSFKVLSTQENLQAAIDGETYESTTMYPNFLKDAETEKVMEATTSFTWAKDTEVKHMEFYKKALETISSSAKETGLPFSWAVCPKCGNTFAEGSIEETCSFCMTPKEKYIQF